MLSIILFGMIGKTNCDKYENQIRVERQMMFASQSESKQAFKAPIGPWYLWLKLKWEPEDAVKYQPRTTSYYKKNINSIQKKYQQYPHHIY